jgi:L-asparaginase
MPLTSDRPTVLLFATGGTIGMRRTERGLAPDPDFPMALEIMTSGICEPLGIDYRINHLTPPIDSANADADTAPRIAAAVRARVRTARPRGVVILHGTDTLAYTAARLAFELDGLGSPVVITGSMEPHGAPGGDAAANLRLAVRAALRASGSAPVAIAFGGELLPAVRATKHQAAEFEAFRASRPIEPHPVRVAEAVSDEASRIPARVISFRFVPGVTADDLRAAIGGRPDGLVLECYGTGTAPTARPGMVDALREACAAMPVVAVTQCDTGGIDFSRYAAADPLTACGVIDGGDMTLEAALAKLGFALDRGARGDALRAVMGLNLVGERG